MKSPLKWHIPGFSNYFAHEDGSIWSLRKNSYKQLQPDCRKIDGRKRYTLRHDDGQYVRKYGSYFVLLATVGQRPNGTESCHEDGDCTNDAPSNLRWDTKSANENDKKIHGTSSCGERSSTAKLTKTKVNEIRQRRTNGELLKSLAFCFGVTEANISYICKNKSWK